MVSVIQLSQCAAPKDESNQTENTAEGDLRLETHETAVTIFGWHPQTQVRIDLDSMILIKFAFDLTVVGLTSGQVLA